jgi:hypothetical protein
VCFQEQILEAGLLLRQQSTRACAYRLPAGQSEVSGVKHYRFRGLEVYEQLLSTAGAALHRVAPTCCSIVVSHTLLSGSAFEYCCCVVADDVHLPSCCMCCCCMQGVVPARFRADKQLVSHDIHTSTYNYKYTFSVEIAPVCKVSNSNSSIFVRHTFLRSAHYHHTLFLQDTPDISLLHNPSSSTRHCCCITCMHGSCLACFLNHSDFPAFLRACRTTSSACLPSSQAP